MSAASIDLRALAGVRRWQVRDDDEDAEVLCHRGLIYPYDQHTLCAWTESGRTWHSLLAAGCRRKQTGDREWAVFVPAEAVDRVVRIMRPKRKPGRTATAEDREHLANIGFRRTVRPRFTGPGANGEQGDDPKPLPEAA